MSDPVDTLDTPLDWAERLVAQYRDTKARRESLALHKAIRLAPTLEVCEALLRGEKVPRSKLDSEWLRAYGL